MKFLFLIILLFPISCKSKILTDIEVAEKVKRCDSLNLRASYSWYSGEGVTNVYCVPPIK